MASQTAVSSAVIQNLQTQDYALVAEAALVVYEHVITIDQELRYVWRREKWSSVTALFLLNRYTLLLLVILQLLPALPGAWCIANQVTQSTVILVQLLVLAVFPALRIYAIWNRNTVLFLLVLLPNLVPFATNLYISIEETPVYIGAPDFVCTANYRQPNVRLSDKVDRCTRALVIISDFSVIILTWAKTYQCVRHAIKHDIESQLFMLVFRDGTIYFCALLAFNVITIATWSPMQIGTSPVIKNLLFTCTPILISRFLLNLRRAGQPSESILSGDSVFQSRLSFASNPENRITGNLGEELHGFIVDAEEEETDAVAYESHSSLQDPAAQEEDEPAVADEVGPQQDTRGEAMVIGNVHT